MEFDKVNIEETSVKSEIRNESQKLVSWGKLKIQMMNEVRFEDRSVKMEE